MERDGRCVRDIEARERPLGRDAAEAVACLPRELAQAFALGAEHQGEGERQRSGLERLGSFLGKPNPQETGLADRRKQFDEDSAEYKMIVRQLAGIRREGYLAARILEEYDYWG